jgi:hypothetical protein
MLCEYLYPHFAVAYDAMVQSLRQMPLECGKMGTKIGLFQCTTSSDVNKAVDDFHKINISGRPR